MNELIEELFLYFSSIGKLNAFNSEQKAKFKYACEKAVFENPDLDFNELLIACRIYFNFIRDFPELDLGEIHRQ